MEDESSWMNEMKYLQRSETPKFDTWLVEKARAFMQGYGVFLVLQGLDMLASLKDSQWSKFS